MEKTVKAVITVIGKDMVGILAKVSNLCADQGVNVLEVTQSILQDMFVMVMLVDITHAAVEIADLSDQFGNANHNYQSLAGDEAETKAISESIESQTVDFLVQALLPADTDAAA